VLERQLSDAGGIPGSAEGGRERIGIEQPTHVLAVTATKQILGVEGHRRRPTNAREEELVAGRVAAFA
jgi:hypothetical protein